MNANVLGSPLKPQKFLCIFRCHSGVAVVGAEKHLERKPLPGSQKGSFQDITLQSVTSAAPGMTVCS